MKTVKIFSTALSIGVLFAGIASVHAGGGHDEHSHASKDSHQEKLHEDHAQDDDSQGHDHEQHMSQVGAPATTAQATKTIEVKMLDSMKYEFSGPLDIHRGEVVRFIVTNKGKIPHEFSIGNTEEQHEHAEMMRSMPNMVHKDGNTLSLAPEQTGEITWRFQGDPEIVFACNIPGHFEAGMFAKITLNSAHGNH